MSAAERTEEEESELPNPVTVNWLLEFVHAETGRPHDLERAFRAQQAACRAHAAPELSARCTCVLGE